MTQHLHPGASIIPCLRYRDAPAAIDWLCLSFGFEEHLIVPGPNGTIAHAQLTLGNGMIMLGSATDTEFGRFMEMRTPSAAKKRSRPTS